MVAESEALYAKGTELAKRQRNADQYLLLLEKIRNSDIQFKDNGCYMVEELIRILK